MRMENMPCDPLIALRYVDLDILTPDSYNLFVGSLNRYIQKNRDVIWSEDNYVEGYTKTGNTKVQ